MPAKASGAGASSSSATIEVPVPRRSVIPGGTLYRGNEGMWSWVLHRITGVAIYFFLLVHILDTALVRVSPEAYNVVIGAYNTPIMGIGELALVGAIVVQYALLGLVRAQLRQAVAIPGAPDPVRTVRSAGYALEGV